MALKGSQIDRVYSTVAAFLPNANVQFQLDTTSIVKELQFQLTGTLTLAGYTAPPVARVESIENLIGNLVISGTGKNSGAQSDQFCATDAAYMAYRTLCMEGTKPARLGIGTANAAYAFSSTFKKYFGALRLGNPALSQNCYLDSRNLSTFTAAFQWRDVNAMIEPGTGTGGTATLSGAQVTILSREYQGSAATGRNPYIKESQRTFDLTNLSGLDRVFLNTPVGNWISRQTFKTTIGDQVYCDPSDAVIATTARVEGAHVKTVQNGNFTWLDTTEAQLKAHNKTDYGLESFPVGYATKEYVGGINVVNATDMKNLADITYTSGSVNTLQITDEQVIFAK
jgi:hypothetical protein